MAGQIKILVAEDMVFNQHNIRYMLQHCLKLPNESYVIVNDGRELVDCVKKSISSGQPNPFFLILLDYNMP